MCKNQEKAYSLLRPFDLEKAKKGAPLCSVYNDITITYIAGPDNSGLIVFSRRGEFFLRKSEHLRMAPLCWVEGKPVYKGDVLYWNMNPTQCKVIATDEGFKFDDGSLRTYESVYEKSFFTWTPPKVKREGWVNIHLTRTNNSLAALASNVYSTAEAAAESRGDLCIACVRIEWEE